MAIFAKEQKEGGAPKRPAFSFNGTA